MPAIVTSLFHQVKNIFISGGIFTAIGQGQDAGLEGLQVHIVPDAMHDSGKVFNRPKCHENTRVAVLQRLMDYILGLLDPETVMIWLHGDAGAGKSTIAQTLAELCSRQRLLLAAFFFSRTDADRSTHTGFVATIAYQLAIAIPELRQLITAAVELDPSIFRRSLETQMNSLVIGPIRSLKAGSQLRMTPGLIVVDGLDECSDPQSQSDLIRLLIHTAQVCEFKILVSSRAETVIKATFNSQSVGPVSSQLALDHKFHPDVDIHNYLESVFANIKATHPQARDYIPSRWPGDEIIEQLVRTASGQFIYVAIVASYISSLCHDPIERLEVILGLHPGLAEKDLPFANLDALYRHVLSIISEENVKDVLRILGLLIVGDDKRWNLSFISQIAQLLSLKPAKIEMLLAPLASIVNVTQRDDGKIVKIAHASLGDFLLDEKRSRHFYIDRSKFFGEMALLCLANIQNLDQSYGAWNCRAYCLRTVPTLLGKSAWTADVRLALLGMSLKRVLELNSHTLMRDTVSLAVHLVQHFESQQDKEDIFSHLLHGLEECFALLLNQLPTDSRVESAMCLLTLLDSLSKRGRYRPIEERKAEAAVKYIEYLLARTPGSKSYTKKALCTRIPELIEGSSPSPRLTSFILSRQLKQEYYVWPFSTLGLSEVSKKYLERIELGESNSIQYSL